MTKLSSQAKAQQKNNAQSQFKITKQGIQIETPENRIIDNENLGMFDQ